ncbi:MAG: phage major capsid protein [Syntrophales bacterium LBB04]|nr:phage major capsid protein [Syntrophales bacterium LBB04]
MAEIGELNATTDVYWLSKEPVDIVNKASALCWKLMGNALAKGNWEIKAHELVDGGTMIKVTLQYGVANSGTYGATTVIDTSKKDIVDAARFGWGGLYGSNAMNLDELTQNSGGPQIIDLTKTKVDSIIKSARTALATDLIGTATGDHLLGLGNLFNTNTSIAYGSLTEAAVSQWKANVIDTAEAISFEVLQKIFRTPGMGSHADALPDFCVTSTILKDGYERSLHPQQRYSHEPTLQAGWDNVAHKGAPIVADVYYDDNSMTSYLDALNLRYLSLRAHPKYNFTKPVWVSKEVIGQPDSLHANTRFRGQFLCSNRRLQVRHTGLTEPA